MNNKGIRKLSLYQLKEHWLKLTLINLVPYLILFSIFWFLNEYLWILIAIPVMFAIKQIYFDVACLTEDVDFKIINLNPKMILRVYIYKFFIRLIERIYFLLKVVGLASVFGGGLFAIGATFLLVHKQMILGLIIPKKLGLAGLGLGAGFLGAGIIFKFILFEIIFIALYLGVTYLKTMYFFTEYILMRDNQELSIIKALKQARILMKGEEINFIKLELSFAGWYILSVLSFGIGFLFLNSYIGVANANFYMEVLKKKPKLAKEFNLIDGDISILGNRLNPNIEKYNPNIKEDEDLKDIKDFKMVKEFQNLKVERVTLTEEEEKYYKIWKESKKAESKKEEEDE